MIDIDKKRIYFCGKLAGMSFQEAAAYVRQKGAKVVSDLNTQTDLVVLGDVDYPANYLSLKSGNSSLAVKEKFEKGEFETFSESEFWRKIGWEGIPANTEPYYTPSMLSELLQIPASTVRYWYRRGFLISVCQIRKLVYFDIQDVTAAQQLANLTKFGLSLDSIEKQLRQIQEKFPDIQRPLVELKFSVRGKSLQFEYRGQLYMPSGQLLFDFFSASKTPENPVSPDIRDTFLENTSVAPSSVPSTDLSEDISSVSLSAKNPLTDSAANLTEIPAVLDKSKKESEVFLEKITLKSGNINELPCSKADNLIISAQSTADDNANFDKTISDKVYTDKANLDNVNPDNTKADKVNFDNVNSDNTNSDTVFGNVSEFVFEQSKEQQNAVFEVSDFCRNWSPVEEDRWTFPRKEIDASESLLTVPPSTLLPTDFLEMPFQERENLDEFVHQQVRDCCEKAWRLESEGKLQEALLFYRNALVLGGPDVSIYFQMAELLDQLGDKTAARERYYIVVEMDEDYVEARAGLGRVLTETGEFELAVSAFKGALQYHPNYTEVHFLLGKTLFRLDRFAEAEEHLRTFLLASKNSDWSKEASQMIQTISKNKTKSVF